MLRDHAAPVSKGSWQPYAAAAAPEPAEPPQTYEQAISRPQAEFWKQAMDEEMSSLAEHGTWTLERTPSGVVPVGTRWIFAVKNQQGGVPRYKARLVAQGYTQRAGIDYEEAFAPVHKHTTLRLLLAMVAEKDMELHSLDIKTAFLNGDLKEDVWVQQPPGYSEWGKQFSCKLHKALYGLKQAPRAWHKALNEQLQNMGFNASQSDPGLYVQHTEQGSTYLIVWVDDITIAADSIELVQNVKSGIMQVFEARDLGETSVFIGMEVQRDRARRLIKLSQMSAVRNIIERYGQGDARVRDVPMAPGVQLTKEGDPLGEDTPYRQLVGSLLYVSTCTRPDIAFAVGALARHMSAPTQEHWVTAKGVVRYLTGTAEHGIMFKGGVKGGVKAWSDADYGGDLDTRRSTTGFVFVTAGGAVSWMSKLQQTVAVSTAEAEYMAASAAVKEAIWLRNIMGDLGFKKATEAQIIYTDNQAALALARNPILNARAKHIDIIYHFARERVQLGQVCFEWCPTTKMVADILTKPLQRDKFARFRTDMGISG